MATPNKTRTTDDDFRSKEPKRINAFGMAADLGINLLESKFRKMQREGGVEIPGLNMLSASLKDSLLEKVQKYESALPFLETGMKTVLFATVPGLTETQRVLIGEAIDLLKDEVEQAALSRNDRQVEVGVSQAISHASQRFDAIIAEMKTHKEKRHPYDALYSQLKQNRRTILMDVVSTMYDEKDPEYEATWLTYRDNIPSVEILEDLIMALESTKLTGPVELPAGPFVDDDAKAAANKKALDLALNKERAKTLVRFLRSHYGEKKEPEKKVEAKIPALFEIVKTVLKGDKENEHVKKVEKKVTEFREDADKQAALWKEDTDKRMKADSPEMQFGWYVGITIIVLGFVVGYFAGRALLISLVSSAVGFGFIVFWMIRNRLAAKTVTAPADAPPPPTTPAAGPTPVPPPTPPAVPGGGAATP